MNEIDRIFDNLWRQTVGFDNLKGVFQQPVSSTFPKYDIIKTDETNYVVNVALAGYEPKDVSVVVEKGVLKVSSDGLMEDESADVRFLHRGIAKRAFNLALTLGDHMEVKQADFTNGILAIFLEKHVPEELLPKKIPINTPKLISPPGDE